MLRALLVLLASAGSVWGTYTNPPDCPRMRIKASVARSVRPGQTLTYKIRVKNGGKAAIENLYIEAQLPPYVTYPVPPKREGSVQVKPSYGVSPKGVTFDRVANLGNVIELENVRAPPTTGWPHTCALPIPNLCPSPSPSLSLTLSLPISLSPSLSTSPLPLSLPAAD